MNTFRFYVTHAETRAGQDRPLELLNGYIDLPSHWKELRDNGLIETGYGGVTVATADGKKALQEAVNV